MFALNFVLQFIGTVMQKVVDIRSFFSFLFKEGGGAQLVLEEKEFLEEFPSQGLP